MQIELMKKQDQPEIKEIYMAEFPEAERKPFSMLLKLSKKKKAELYVIRDDHINQIVGLAFFLIKDSSVLFDYFAIKKEYQSRGYGSQVLSYVREMYKGKKIFGEVEYPNADEVNNDQRLRRMDFYLRNGLVETGIIICFFGCTLELMCFDNQKISYMEYTNFLYSIFGRLKRGFIKKNIRLIKE